MSLPFAKIFQSEKNGQILVVKDVDDEYNPAVIYSVMPDSLGMCSATLSFEDNDGGWGKRDTLFDATTLETAEAAVSQIGVFACHFEPEGNQA